LKTYQNNKDYAGGKGVILNGQLKVMKIQNYFMLMPPLSIAGMPSEL
jgi:hypothetical protein